jgi:hypothetical protein
MNSLERLASGIGLALVLSIPLLFGQVTVLLPFSAEIWGVVAFRRSDSACVPLKSQSNIAPAAEIAERQLRGGVVLERKENP